MSQCLKYAGGGSLASTKDRGRLGPDLLYIVDAAISTPVTGWLADPPLGRPEY